MDRRVLRNTASHLVAWISLSALAASGADAKAGSLRVGIVQMATHRTLPANRDRIVSGIAEAARQGVRVVVFPEGALRGEGGEDRRVVDDSLAAIAQAGREAKVYVLLGGWTYSPAVKKNANWMVVFDPQGREIFRYDKLYDNHRAAMPGVFSIDGVACGAMICADRWLRGVAEIPIQQGAQISFELSNNFASEWVAPLQWYWYVPRALRNNVWVIFANTGNAASDADGTIAPADLRHGHSAVIAPDGRVVAAAEDNRETVVVADLDVGQATRAEALARSAHDTLRPFWEAGLRLQQEHKLAAPPVAQLPCEPTTVTLAAAQIVHDLPAMEEMIRQARHREADLIAFPARAIDETALERLCAAARDNQITVVVGGEHRDGLRVRNSAFVLGPDGIVLTRYDQLSAVPPYQPGTDPASMWFRVKGVPAVVLLERDALWTELAELAAVAGARILVQLNHDPAADPDADLRRLQVWSNAASYLTLTATVNLVGSTLWDDLRATDETRAEVRGLPRPDTGSVQVYSPFSANVVARAGSRSDLLVVTRRIPGANSYHPSRTANFNPQMDAWYRMGAAIVSPK